MQDLYKRTHLLIGNDGTECLKNARVAVFGAGGVGGYVIESLVRCGIGTLDIFDNDKISGSNLNRQIVATRDTIGMNKTDAAEARAKSINEDIVINKHNCFFMPDNSHDFDFTKFSYAVDAIDTVTGKIEIIMRGTDANIPVISCMGTGNKLDPLRLKISDIYATSVCPLARVMRRELKLRGIKKLKVLYSDEKPLTPKNSDEFKGRTPVPGSVPFVPAAAGILIAAEVVNDLLKT